MPRVNKVVARKDYPECGIKKGQTYFHWKFKGEPVKRKLTYPTREELTRSEFLLTVYGIENTIDLVSVEDVMEQRDGAISDILSDIGCLRDDTEEKLGNMPEGFQQGSTGQLLEERISNLDDWESRLDSIDFDALDDKEASDGAKMEAASNIVDEIQACRYEG